MKHGSWIALLLLGTVLSGCDRHEAMPEVSKVSGTLVYRERMMLSPEAVATVSLLDVSIADAPAKTIAEVDLQNPGQVPIAFELEYDPELIDERMSYTVRATIHDRGRLLFSSDTHTPVLTRGAGNEAEVSLTVINLPTVSPPAVPETGSPRTESMKLAGMFSYMADAALFEDCRNKKVYPVSMEGAYIELEKAYSNSGIDSGEPMMVQVEGRFLARPAMEGNHNEVKLIVDSFTAILPEQSCLPLVDEVLQNTYWKLIEIGDEAVKTPKGQKEAHMILSTQESRVHGNAGCNNFFGNYVLDGEKLGFGQTGVTMMACPEGMDTEAAFLGALESADGYRISGLMMELLKGEERLAKFEAVHLP